MDGNTFFLENIDQFIASQMLILNSYWKGTMNDPQRGPLNKISMHAGKWTVSVSSWWWRDSLVADLWLSESSKSALASG